MDFAAKDAVQLLVQAGFAYLCVLLVNKIGTKLDTLTERIFWLGSIVVDHKARAGDAPLPKMKPDTKPLEKD